MPRKIRPKLCGCGCGEKTRGGLFMPGHDSKTLSAIVECVGGTLELKRIVEDALDCHINVNEPFQRPIIKKTTQDYLILKEDTANQLVSKLMNLGYSKKIRQVYDWYSKERGDSVFISHSLNIIRCTPNTEASSIIESKFGSPNGYASKEQDDKYNSWFFNGYEGRGGTGLD